jgi:hypothetical protein
LVPAVPGFFLYYPSQRQQPAALLALIETVGFVGAPEDGRPTPRPTQSSVVPASISRMWIAPSDRGTVPINWWATRRRKIAVD